MKIAYFTEAGFSGKISREHPNMRVDMSWMCALDATHWNLNTTPTDHYDLGIIVIPKTNPEFNVDKIKKHCTRIASMQEGPQWYFQDYPIEQQIWYFNTLNKMDFLFVHNEIDKTYFEGVTDKECKIMPSLMIEDQIKDLPTVERAGVMIGGNFCSWYGGFDSYVVAQEFNEKIFVPSMGRKVEGEERLDNLHHLPYMDSKNWIYTLNQIKYGVHLMRTHAAGTFALNCAYLGIPCIGYEGLDTQMKLHPDCTVPIGDITKAKQIAEKLRIDEEFYLYCINIAKENYSKYYSESEFMKRISQYD